MRAENANYYTNLDRDFVDGEILDRVGHIAYKISVREGI